MRKITLSIFIIVFSVLSLLIISWKNFLNTPLIPVGKPVYYVFNSGSSVKTLAADLSTQGLLKNRIFLITLAYIKGVARNLKPGEYLFVPGTKPEQLLDQIANGRVISYRFTIVEGWTFKQLLTALHTDSNLIHKLNTPTTTEAIQKLGLPPQNPEGLFFPATYYFTKGMSDIGILRMSYQKMAKALKKVWSQRDPHLFYQTSYEALIAASLIEKETAQASERSIIAGVLMRRLQIGMPLQVDAALVYGLGDNYMKKLDRVALKQDTPYNTYLHKGLPPTPIAMPSLRSIEAALHPDQSNALYFVAKGDGTHQFSDTLEAQNQAVAAYLAIMNLPKVIRKSYTPRSCQQPLYIDTFLQKLCLLP